MYGLTSTRLVNTYIMIVRNSSLSKALGVAPLALPSFIFGFIVTSGWIVHAWKGFTIVFCCVVGDFIQNVCFCNGSFYFAFIFAFGSKDFLLSLNQVAPTSLNRPPIRASYGRCKIICCIGLKKPGGKIFSNLQSNTGANFSICSTTVRDNSLAHNWRKKLLNSASTCQTWSGR